MVFKDSAVLLLIVFACWINTKSSEAHGLFGFDIHHRYSDTVRDLLGVDGLPEKGSLDYFAAMAHRDHLFKARRLATTPSSSPFLTFMGSNETYRLPSLGFLHYAMVSVGTPPLKFLVALDTGSSLFWLPCDCTSCVRSVNTTSGKTIYLNIYSPGTSSTSSPIPCNSTMCGQRRGCSLRPDACDYKVEYGSRNTSSTGILVDDVLHLGKDASPQDPVNAPITLGKNNLVKKMKHMLAKMGTQVLLDLIRLSVIRALSTCGIIQTGGFLDGGAINGLFGLGMNNLSVPSILANRGLAANSFSMCFRPDGLGRIDFGDKGSPDQKVTPINLQQSHQTYNITVTQIAVEKNVSNLEFTAIFDSGTSVTYLNDPAYSIIAEGFNSQVTEPRYQPKRKIIFDYCYALRPNQDSVTVPNLNLTMKGGNQFYVTEPIIEVQLLGGGYGYCLAIVKTQDINIIGQNFMTGYRIVFDREEMVLGWKESNCYDSINGSNTLPVNKGHPPAAPSPSFLNPEVTPAGGPRSPASSHLPPSPSPPPPSSLLPGSDAAHFSSMTNGLMMVIVSIFFHFFIFSS